MVFAAGHDPKAWWMQARGRGFDSADELWHDGLPLGLRPILIKDKLAMAPAIRVLLLEEDQVLAAALIEQFAAMGEFTTTLATTPAHVMSYVSGGEALDLVLCADQIGALHAGQLAAMCRDAGFKGPIILMTDGRKASDALDGGSISDQVTKPFRLTVLLARMRAHLRSHEQSDDATVSIGPYAFRPAARLLVCEGGEDIRLTDKEAAILRFLYRAQGAMVARETLLEEVWGYNSGVTTHTLETHIYRLRQKIEPQAGHTEILMTEQGGYRLDL